jgi:hypothetical protein
MQMMKRTSSVLNAAYFRENLLGIGGLNTQEFCLYGPLIEKSLHQCPVKV